MKNIFTVILIGLAIIYAQNAFSQRNFIPPFDFPLYLSGNFGELRANHFHGGVDFKTEGVEGKPVRCIADGYVSRVSVSAGGYGNALYVTHYNGTTSVYGHLKSFIRPLADMVEKYQYEHETFVVDLPLDSLQYPFRQGEQIAWSGNTGFSFGPHLHMEIRETGTNEPIDPLQFYMKKVKDTTAPRAKAVMLYPQRGAGIVNDNWHKQSFDISMAKGSHCLAGHITAWGKIGVGIKAFDYMDGTANTYGVQTVILYVDSVEVFRSVIDKYAFNENRMLNSWTDFDEFKRKNSWFMKSFIAPGNSLRVLYADSDRGIVNISEEKDYHFKYVLKDLYGNKSEYRFKVKGKRQYIPKYHPQVKHYLSWDKLNLVQEPGMQFIVPRGMVYEDVALNSRVKNDSVAISFEYQLHDSPVPLHNFCELMIGVRNMPLKDSTKYYIARKIGKSKYYVGGKYENGWMKGNIRELGTYTVAIDTIPPRVEPVNKPSWNRSGKIVFKISDWQTGIKSYKGFIDGKFALFAFNAKNATLSCRLDPRYVKKGRKHSLEILVEDNCGNVRRVIDFFMW